LLKETRDPQEFEAEDLIAEPSLIRLPDPHHTIVVRGDAAGAVWVENDAQDPAASTGSRGEQPLKIPSVNVTQYIYIDG
jgi:hypothetical protein